MQRGQRRRFAAPPPDRHQCLALVQHILLDLLQAGHRQLPRLFVCAIMGHQKELLSALQRSFERIVLLFCSFGNPLSYFVGVNGAVGWRWSGPLWSPGGGGVSAFPLHVSTGNRTRATIKALPATPHHP